MVMFFFHGTIAIDGFSMVLPYLDHHHWMFFFQINHWYQWFFDGFPKFRCDGQRWFWPWKRPKNARNRDGSYFATIVRIISSSDQQVNKPWKTVFFLDFKLVVVFVGLLAHSGYHRKLAMVFKVTITIEWNGWGQPLGSMVFRWFWG